MSCSWGSRVACAVALLAACAACGPRGEGGPGPLGDRPLVVVETSRGAFSVELFPEVAPVTVVNFLRYVDEGFYAGTIFHRVVPDFVIQGGGYTEEHQQKATRAPIENEGYGGLKNVRYSLAMARTRDLHSATSQWFVNLRDNPFLDHDPEAGAASQPYAVFGRVVAGFEVVDAIGSVPTGAREPFGSDAPLTPVVIRSVRRR